MDVASDEWGTDIGSVCDFLLNSECSLTGGFYCIATQSGALWADIDKHLGVADQTTKESLVIEVPEPIPTIQYSPRETSVARYMHMDLTKIRRPDNSSKACPSQTTEMRKTSETNKGQTLNIPGVDKPAKMSTRPKSSGDIDKLNRPKFFRLDEYGGTRPYTADAGLLRTRKVRNLPYFPEIQLHVQHQINMGAVNVKDKGFPKQSTVGLYRKTTCFGPELEKVTTVDKRDTDDSSSKAKREANVLNKEPVIENRGFPEAKPKSDQENNRSTVEKKPSKFDDTKTKSEKHDRQKTKRQDPCRPIKVRKVRMIHVNPNSDLKETPSPSEDGKTEAIPVKNNRNDSKRRLRNALRGLHDGLRSVFSACISFVP